MRIKINYWLIIIFSSLILVACGGGGGGSSPDNPSSTPEPVTGNQVIKGSIAGATINVYRLSDLSTSIETTQANSNLQSLEEAGVFTLELSGLPDDELVLVVASGGQDIDANDDGLIDAFPVDNLGNIHALSPVNLLKQGNVNVTALSDVAWQRVKADVNRLSQAELLVQYLEIIAQLTLDANSDSDIGLSDLLSFHPLDEVRKNQLLFDYDVITSDISSDASGSYSELLLADASDTQKNAYIDLIYQRLIGYFEIPEMRPAMININSADLSNAGLTAQQLEIINFSDSSTDRRTAVEENSVNAEKYSTLLSAEGEGGTVFLSLKLPDSDSGEVLGDIEMGLDSTVLALSLLMLGSLDDQIKATFIQPILDSEEFLETVEALRILQQSNPYILEKIGEYPEFISNLKIMSSRVFENYLSSTQENIQQTLSQQAFASTVSSRSSNTLLKANFSSDVNISPSSVSVRNPLSPWYTPKTPGFLGTGDWDWYVHPDNSELSAVDAPFFAQSTVRNEVFAIGNPSHVVYGIELYNEAGVLLNTFFIGRNSSLFSKVVNSGAVRYTLDSTFANARYIRVVKFGGDLNDSSLTNNLRFYHGLYSFTTTVGVISITGGTFLKNVSNKAVKVGVKVSDYAGCGFGVLGALDLTSDITLENLGSQLFSETEAILLDCISPIVSDIFVQEAVASITEIIAAISIEVAAKASNPIGWAATIVIASAQIANDAAPFIASIVFGQREGIYEVTRDQENSISSVISRSSIPNVAPIIPTLQTPEVPTDLNGTIGPTGIASLEWSTVSDVTGYRVMYRLSGQSFAPQQYAQSTRPFTRINGLIPGESYDFAVSAYTVENGETASSEFSDSLGLNVPASTSTGEEILRNIVINNQNGHYYEFIAGTYTWQQSRDLASSMSYAGLQGYLVTITSAAENEVVHRLITDKSAAWIGATDLDAEGEWRWVTGPESGQQFWQGGFNGNPVNNMYTNWNSDRGQPATNSTRESCGNMAYELFDYNGRWADGDCSSPIGFVVEYSISDGTSTDNL